MRKFLTSTFLMATLALNVNAQDGLFQEEKSTSRKGFIICLNGSLDFPAADMAKRFGVSYRLGPGLMYKTTSNWLFGTKFDFILGGKIKEDSLLTNITDEYGDFIDVEGRRSSVRIFERGYMTGVQAGRIFNFSKSNSDNGLLVMTGIGFMQHKIAIIDRDGKIVQVNGDYKKGYDRLTNGWYLEQYIGYNHFSPTGLLNFNIGLDFVAGFTKGRRDYLYDVMRPDGESRVDIMFGIRGGWYIPIFKRKSEELFFE